MHFYFLLLLWEIQMEIDARVYFACTFLSVRSEIHEGKSKVHEQETKGHIWTNWWTVEWGIDRKKLLTWKVYIGFKVFVTRLYVHTV